MSQEPRPRRWTDSLRAQLVLAILFLVLTVAWLVNPARHTWSYWIPALSWLLLASVRAARAIRQVTARHSQRQH